ncbi:MAG: molecular chaperone [Sphingobium sp.]|nr:molecular chaperone [Sphingobium sp.]
MVMLMHRTSSFAFAAYGLLMALPISPAPAYGAAAVMIWPVDPVLGKEKQAEALWIQNKGAAPAVMQIRIFRWTQVDGKDHYEPQQDIESSPPIASIAPGARQMIRLSAPLAKRPEGEGTYRIIIDEVPVASDGTARRTGVQFQMRYSVPLFTYKALTPPSDTSHQTLRCKIFNRDGKRQFRLENHGATHVRLLNIGFQEKAGLIPLENAKVSYILAGSALAWPVPAGVSERPTLSAVNRGSHRHEITNCVEG